MAIDPKREKSFEELGITNVRSLAEQWTGPLQTEARKWIKRKDDEDQRRNDDANSFAARAVKLALIANIIAAIASAIAVISLMVSIFKH